MASSLTPFKTKQPRPPGGTRSRAGGTGARVSARGGFTLVELIVSFAILGILFVAVTMILTSGMSVFSRAKATSQAQGVSDIILDKVAGEIAGAQAGADEKYTLTIADGHGTSGALPLQRGTGIAFYNRSGSQIYVTTDDADQLLIHYRPVTGDDGAQKLEAVDWQYDDSVYMGFRIDVLTFTQHKNARTGLANIIEIDLKLEHTRTGFTYEVHRYVECYNFTGVNDIRKISYGPIPYDYPPEKPKESPLP